MPVYENLLKKETSLSVIGLGYVGLPIALEFARKIKVVGFDIKPDRVELMKNRIDPSGELGSEAFVNTDILITADPADLKLKPGKVKVHCARPPRYLRPNWQPKRQSASSTSGPKSKCGLAEQEPVGPLGRHLRRDIKQSSLFALSNGLRVRRAQDGTASA